MPALVYKPGHMRPDHIKRLRETLDVSQGELAALLGVHFMTVSKWERGLLDPSAFYSGLLERMAHVRALHLKRTIVEQGSVAALLRALGVVV